MLDFSQSTAVITGAGSGIGYELARLFAEHGTRLVLADIEAPALDAALARLETIGADAVGRVTDVGNNEDVAALLTYAQQCFGNIHILCNNAGVFTGGLLWEQTEDDFEWLMRVNQWGVIHGIRHFIPHMIRHGEPCHVVNTASMAALCSLPFAGIYHMTKHAVLALSECLHHELELTAPQIKVSCLCPELVNTGIARSGRNRPANLASENPTQMSAMSHAAITDATADALHPRVLAERIIAGIKQQQFYLLPPADNAWHATATSRWLDIQQRHNPRFVPPLI
jgi:NAD(P)-dependent dehydrogenase (short-subunit alcohol dehydrogenase family)